MNNEKFQKGIQDIKKIGLTNSEKFEIKSDLDFYIETSTPSIPVKSPWFNSYHSMFTKLYTASLAGILFFVIGTGTYYNAELSLPGDTLYSLKVSVIEPLKYTAAFSEVEKANLEVVNLDERLREAEILEVKGKLTDALSTELQNRINTHTEAYNKIVGELSSQNKLEEDSDLKIDFEAKMNAHSRIIDSIRDSDIEGKNINKIKIAIQKKDVQDEIQTTVATAKTMAFSVNLDESTATPAPTFISASTTSTTTDKVFYRRKKSTEDIINSVKKKIEKSKKNIKANQKILDDAEKLISDAQKSLDDAEKQNNSGDSNTAKEILNNSRIRAKEADKSLKLSQDLSKQED